MSEYQQLIEQLKRRPGRPRLTEEERERNRQERKRRTAMRSEARRRAQLVLQYRHESEYEALLANEYAFLEGEARNKELRGIPTPTERVPQPF